MNILNTYLDSTPHYQGNFQAISNNKKSSVINYFDSLYSYPPTIKLKWDGLDEFTNDLLIEENYGVLEHNLPFLDFAEDWFFNNKSQDIGVESYTKDQYIDGYFDKVNSTNFYKNETKKIQNSLKSVPVYTILNGNGEIILNKPSNDSISKNINSLLKEKIYDFCGSFDNNVEKRPKLGLFFLNRLDAETYLKAVAQADIDGTQTLGLSINCISLDSAYRVTREYHPGIDFRFVPNLNEIQTFLNTKRANSNLIVENEQQQLRFRPRVVNLFPILEKIGFQVSQSIGARSFIQTNEYFKGVPIYIVQTTENPRNIVLDQYFNTVSTIDNIWGKFTQTIDRTIGMGNKNFLQGTLQDVDKATHLTNYIFFDQDQALNFVTKAGRKVGRYSGAKASTLEFFVRKPKIFVYNLEDFIESWEDTINVEMTSHQDLKNIYHAKETFFIPPAKETKEMLEFTSGYQKKPLRKIFQALDLKVRVLKRNIGIFLSAN